jgi:hypothetical protein
VGIIRKTPAATEGFEESRNLGAGEIKEMGSPQEPLGGHSQGDPLWTSDL